MKLAKKTTGFLKCDKKYDIVIGLLISLIDPYG